MACVVVLDGAGRVLLGLREDFDVWGLPGGHLEPGESPEEGAAREFLEELGVAVELDHRIGAYTRLGGWADAHSTAFLGRPTALDFVVDGTETLDVGWFPVDELPPMLWWSKLPVLDAVAGRRDLQRELSIEITLGRVTFDQLRAARDASPLGRRAFYLETFPEPALDDLLASSLRASRPQAAAEG